MNDDEHQYNKHKAALAVKKTQGTITKILQMIDDNIYCPEIIQQVDAAIGLLKSSKKTLLVGHLEHCVEQKLKENKTQAIDELIKIFDLK